MPLLFFNGCIFFALCVKEDGSKKPSGSFTLFFSGHPGYILLAIFFTALFLLLLFSFSVVFIQAMGYHVPILTILAI